MEITLQGNIKFFRVPEILNFLNLGAKTGTLNIVSGNKEVYIHMENGSIIFATTNEERFRLSSVLFRRKKLSESQCRAIESSMAAQREKFGKLAVDQKILTEHELREFLKVQVSEIIFDCFIWTAGAFSFVDVMHLPGHAVTISIDVRNLLMEGARRIDEFALFSQLLPHPGTVLKVVGDPQSQTNLHLTLDEWKILFLINGRRTINQICEEASEDVLNVYRLLYGLYVNKIVEPTSPELQAAQSELPVARPEEQSDDTSLLVRAGARLSYRDVLKVTLARLTLQRPDVASETFALIEQEYLVGRQLGNAIHISDPSVSNVHARIFKGPEGYVLEDLNSRNGTFINGERIDRRLLHDNDAVRLGNSFLTYNIVYEVKQV